MKDTRIKKVHRLLDLLISMGILALGLIFMFVIPSWNWLGISLLITAAFMLPFYRTGYVIKNQEGVFLKKEILLPRECKRQIAEYLEGRSDNLDISPFNMGGLLLELYYKKDHSKQLGQIFDYEGNVYTSQSELSVLDDEHVRTLLKYES